MNSLLAQFCESRRRWLIVTIVTFVLGLVIVLPQVDQYRTARESGERLRAQLSESKRVAADLPEFERKVAAEQEKLTELELRTVTDKTLAVFRNDLVDRVRQSGCQVRRINVGATQGRPWKQNDDPLAESVANSGEPTGFVLESRSVSLSVAGGLAEVRKLLDSLTADGKMAHARSLDLRPAGANRKGVQLDLEMVYFAIARPKAT